MAMETLVQEALRLIRGAAFHLPDEYEAQIEKVCVQIEADEAKKK